MRAAIYVQRRKARHFTDAMLAGFAGKDAAREMPSEPGVLDPDADLHILGGLQFGSLPLLQQIMAKGADYVFWDRAYLGGGTQTDRLRITRGAYQQNRVRQHADLTRFSALGGRLEPWRQGGAHILLVPPGEAIRELFGLGDWLADTLAKLSRVTDREIDVSHKGDPRPLSARLAGCHCVITWTSNVAVEAICAGVPAFVSAHCAAAPVAGSLLDLVDARAIEHPRRPTREAWAASLAWGQFSIDEIRGGAARRVVMGE